MTGGPALGPASADSIALATFVTGIVVTISTVEVAEVGPSLRSGKTRAAREQPRPRVWLTVTMRRA